VIVALGVARATRARDRVWIGPACLAMLGVALVLHIVPLPVSVIAADRYLYVPLAGIAAAGAIATSRASARPRQALLVASAAAALVFGALTTWRIDDWSDELRFWIVTTRAARRDNPLPLGELANVLYRAGDYAEALPLYRAIATHAEGANALRHLSNVGSCFAMLGRYDEALAVRMQLVGVEPRNPRRYFDAGLVRLHARRFSQARADFERALALAPDYDDARAMLATTGEAEAAWPAVAAAPDGDPARARWLARLGARTEAQAAYVALAARPTATPDEVLEAARYAVDVGGLEVAEALVVHASVVEPGALWGPLAERLHERGEAAQRIRAAAPQIQALLERYASEAG